MRSCWWVSSLICVSPHLLAKLWFEDSKFSIDATATGAHDIVHPVLGRQAADEVRRTALLQLADMGAAIVQFDHEGREPATAVRAQE